MKNKVLFSIAAYAALGAVNGVAAQDIAAPDITSANGNEVGSDDQAAIETDVITPQMEEDAPAAQTGSDCAKAGFDTFTLAKMTPVAIRIGANVDSKESITGDIFPVSLAEPVMQDGVVLLPAGIEGQGEVIHAKKSGMSGSAGELIITATYLDYDGQRIPLRSMEMSKTGKSNIGLASAIGAAPYVGPVAFFISGKNITVSEGTVAAAKLAQDVFVRIIEDGGTAVGVCKTGVTQ